MNIFYLNSDPYIAAEKQYNKHVVKMILESAQLLCSAHHMLGSEIDVPYKLTHKNHPSAVWTRQSKQNYAWLYFHMLALGDEYTKRYGKKHLTITKCEDVLCHTPGPIFNTGLTDMPQCMPDEYKVSGDSVAAYRNYYINEKSNCANLKKEVLYTKHEQFD